MTLIDAVVVGGIAVALPLALGGRWWRWAAAAASAASSFLVPRGSAAALLVAPFVIVAVVAAIDRLQGMQPWRTRRAAREPAPVIETLAATYAVVAALALVQSRLGVELAGLGEPIVELTAVHYIFAGTVSLTLALATMNDDAARVGASRVAVVCTAVAPPVVAAGFVTGAAAAQIGGAVLMTAGVWTTATLQLRRVIRTRRLTPSTTLLAVSGLAIWLPMVLAVAWAAGQHLDVPALSIPDMVRTHGLVNALGFSLCGLLGRSIERRQR